MYSKNELIILRDKIHLMIQKYKPELQNTLRYRMFEYIVPREIEWASKFLILNNTQLEQNKIYTFFHKNSTGKETKHQIQLLSQINQQYEIQVILDNKEPYIIQINVYRDRNLWHIHYKNKLYRELPDSGNVYSHLMTQYNDILRYTSYDIQQDAITNNDKLFLEIVHLFHDIPEKWTLEICNNHTKDQGKTDAEKQQESKLAYNIIQNEETLTSKEKKILQNIYESWEDKQNIFKFFEKLRWIIQDNKILFANSEYLSPQRQKVFGEMSVGYIHLLTTDFILPSGRKIHPIQLPSVIQILKENKDRIDFEINYSYKYCFEKMHHEKKEIAGKNRELREQIKNNL